MCSLIEFIWIWDKVQGLTLPRHHRKMAAFLNELYRAPDNRRGLLMAFRASGKSTLVGLFGAWVLLQNPNTRVLVVSADEALARKMVRHIRQVLERHPLTRSLIPIPAEEWAADRLTICRSGGLRDPSVLARGLNGNLTGCRADVIICDDVEVPNTCATAGKRSDLRRRLGELDYILTPGGLTLYVGTPHTHETIYQTDAAGFLADYRCLKVPIVSPEGRSAWPERYGSADIEALRRRAGPNTFAGQMMLTPVAPKDSRLSPDRIRWYDGEIAYHESNGRGVLMIGDRQMRSAACWWDPAFGSARGDSSVLACVFFDSIGNAYLHRLEYLIVPPDREATAYQCARVRQIVADQMIPAVHLETNGIGKFLPALLRQEFARHRVPCAVLEEVSRRNKGERILSALDPVLMNGALWVHNRVRQTPLVQEMRDFTPDGTAHDDGLDAVVGCLLCEPVRLQRPPRYGLQYKTEWRF